LDAFIFGKIYFCLRRLIVRIKRYLLLLVSILAISIVAVTPIIAAGPFVKYAGNPVLTGGLWENQGLGGVGSASVIYDSAESKYKMWYSGFDLDGFWGIGYATSLNGINWNKNATPVLLYGGVGDWDAFGVSGPCVIKEGFSSYKMWYTGIDSALVHYWQIGYATSTDGINWVKNGSNPITPMIGSTPVLTPGAGWDADGVSAPSVIKDLDFGIYKMWYTGRTGSHPWPPNLGLSAIGYAWSNDGTNWNKAIDPVLSKSSSGWDDRGVGACSVMKTGINDYTMYYTGWNTIFNVESRIGEASSSNGLNWGRSVDNPVLDVGPASWDSWGVASPAFLIMGGQTKMWYTGSNIATPQLLKIGYAETPPPPSVPSSSNLGTGLMIGGFAILIVSLVIWRSRRYQFSIR
jgi:predicted GH43/DUF377 family glycosyl hydrolase